MGKAVQKKEAPNMHVKKGETMKITGGGDFGNIVNDGTVVFGGGDDSGEEKENKGLGKMTKDAQQSKAGQKKEVSDMHVKKGETMKITGGGDFGNIVNDGTLVLGGDDSGEEKENKGLKKMAKLAQQRKAVQKKEAPNMHVKKGETMKITGGGDFGNIVNDGTV